MGLSTTHLILGVVLLFVFAAIALVLFFVAKWMRQAARESHIPVTAQAVSAPISTAPTTPTAQPSMRSASQLFLCGVHFVGGCIGGLILVSNVAQSSLDALGALCWLVMAAQVAAAGYGAWKLWHHEALGLQLLYWVSLSSVPLLSFSALTYWASPASPLPWLPRHWRVKQAQTKMLKGSIQT